MGGVRVVIILDSQVDDELSVLLVIFTSFVITHSPLFHVDSWRNLLWIMESSLS